MKKLSCVLTAGVIVLGLITGCGKNEADMQYLKDFDPDDYVTLGEYKGLEVTVPSAEVSEEELQDYVNYVLSYYPEYEEITDRTVAEDGDIANIDFVGKLNGEAFDGGTDEGFDLTLGSGQFIDGFEDAVIGMEIGETKDIPLTFPEDYGSEELAGKDVVFTVTLNALKDAEKSYTPEFNDEFVIKNELGFDTAEEFKEYLKQDLIAEAEENNENELYIAVQEAAEANCEFKDAPSGFVDRLVSTMTNSIIEGAAGYGMDAGSYAAYFYGFDAENYEADIKDYCENTLSHQYIMMASIAKAEGITVTQEDVDNDISEMLEGYGNPYTLDEYKEMLGDMEAYREYLIVDRAMEVLIDNAVITEE